MIRGLVARREYHSNTPQIPANPARHAQRGGAALDYTDRTRQQRESAPAERLQRMQRSGCGAAKCQGTENIAGQRAAGMQNDLALPSLSARLPLVLRRLPGDRRTGFAKPRQFRGDIADGAVGCGDENYIGDKNGFRDAGLRRAASDAATRFASAAHRARDHRADAPVFFVQAPPQRAPDASSTDNGYRGFCDGRSRCGARLFGSGGRAFMDSVRLNWRDWNSPEGYRYPSGSSPVG